MKYYNKLTKKQNELFCLAKNGGLKRINILCGSVRSGKTWISLLLWAVWVYNMPVSHNYLMTAKTLTSLKRNCLTLLEEIVGQNNFKYSIVQKEGSLFGRKIILEGASDARAESKIRGLTLQGAYCDELTQFPEPFFEMLLSRLSQPKAKIIATTNPDTPKHWVKVNFIDRVNEIDVLPVNFTIDDNTTLPPEYVENLKKEYTGAFYKRFILGEWANAEGLIYPLFAESPKDFEISKNSISTITNPKANTIIIKYINIGVDFGGNKSAHSIVATGIDADFHNVIALKSIRIPAKGITVETLTNHFVKFAEGINAQYGFIDEVFPDCAEQTIINTFKTKTNYRIRNSIKNPIVDRIRCTDLLISQGRLRILENENQCLTEALSDALWNDKSLEDERLDDGTTDIDTLDAFEYSWEKYIRKFIREV